MNIAHDMQYQIGELLRDMGSPGTMRRKARGAYQPGSGTTDGDGSNLDQDILVVLTNRRSSFAQLVSRVNDSSNTTASERVALIGGRAPDGAKLMIEPETGDLLISPGVQVMITSISSIVVSGSSVGYVAEVRTA